MDVMKGKRREVFVFVSERERDAWWVPRCYFNLSLIFFLFFLHGSSLLDHLKTIFFISTTMVNITQYCKTAPHPHEINASKKASTFYLLFSLLSISSRKIDGTQLWKKLMGPGSGKIWTFDLPIWYITN